MQTDTVRLISLEVFVFSPKQQEHLAELPAAHSVLFVSAT